MPSIRGVWRKARVCAIIFAFDLVTAFAIFGTSRSARGELAMKNSLGDRDDNNDSDGLDRTAFQGFCEIVDEFGLCALEKRDEVQFIRLEKEPDASLENISTKSDVVRKIKQVRQDQSLYGCADLYLREWETQSQSQLVCKTKNTVDPIAAFSVMQFNALAEGLSSSPTNKPFLIDPDNQLFQNDTKGYGYGGFTSIPHPTVTLDFGLRKWRLLEVLLGSEGEAPFDIIALQEIDRYRGFFQPVLTIFGYDGVFVPKKKSPGVRMGWYSDGCALVWKRDTFALVNERCGDFTVGKQVFIVATLRHRASGKSMVVAVTHLKAQPSESNEWIRCRQVEELLAAIDEEAQQAASNDDAHEVPILVLGDFNADPPSHVGFKESAMERFLSHQLRTSASDLQPVRYRSAYNIDDNPNSFFTTWKIRGTTATKRIIDYIFYAGGSMQCVATLREPPVEELEPTKLPGLRYPSDHLHIASKFEIR